MEWGLHWQQFLFPKENQVLAFLEGFDTGNTGFMLVATSLVMLMTPGLAFFYGGLVGRKNVLTIMIQSFVSMGITTIIWYAVGFSLCFSGGEGGIIGNLDSPSWPASHRARPTGTDRSRCWCSSRTR
jgi:ammonia channel protein AmtB